MLQLVSKQIFGPAPPTNEPPVQPGQSFQIHESVSTSYSLTDPAAPVLGQLLWLPSTFTALCSVEPSAAEVAIRFPSPLPTGHELWDTAILDWHIALDAFGQFTNGPAVIVLDILRGGNAIAGFIAKAFARHGIHGFVLHMPQNGRRRDTSEPHDWRAFLPTLRQTAGDARRARDVIAALPLVTGPISIQGTSLGGFVAILAAALDGCFHNVLLALTGGDVYRVLTTGKIDAARVHQRLLTAGYTDPQLQEWLWKIEPLRVAHRLNPKRTWLYSARFDQVVPPPCTKKLAKTIGLDWQHHRQFAGCHYSCVIGAPRFLSELVGATKKTTRTGEARVV